MREESRECISRETHHQPMQKVVEIGSTAGISFDPSAFLRSRCGGNFPLIKLVHVQMTSAVSADFRHVFRQPMLDSSHSRQFPLFRAKIVERSRYLLPLSCHYGGEIRVCLG